MTLSRRSLLLGGTTVAAGAAMAYGYAPTVKALAGGLTGKSHAHGLKGAAWSPEYSVGADGTVTPNPDQRVAFTMCMGCTTKCGVRVRVDKASGNIIRVTGNPYSPLSVDPHIPYDTPVAESLAMLSGQGETGLSARATACGRGNAALSKYRDPRRILKPLKRAGRRGKGHWVEISWEQLIEEVVEGGDLFGEGEVEGLRAIRDLETPLDPDNPEFGPKANQLVVMPSYKNGRLMMAARFAKQSFGTRNLVGHRSYCGLSMRAGYAAFLNNLSKQPHLKPDYRHAKFMLFIATAPGNAGNPFKLQGTLMARARAENDARYIVVDPVLTNSVTQASAERGRWQPINPGTDGALVMGMIRWILENERFDKRFLEQPSKAAATVAGEFSHSNATHLVIDSAEAPDAGKFLRWGQLDPGADEDLAKEPVCLAADGTPVPAGAHDARARLYHDDTVELADGRIVEVATSLTLLRREAEKKSLAEYAQDCGIAEERIIEIAEEFTSYGKRAAADTHGGTMHAAGFYTAYGVAMLNALVGNLNALGGTSAGGGSYKAVAGGPRYALNAFPGKVKPGGVDAGRGGFAYEKTSEYTRKLEAGENPYPSRAPWYSFSQPLGAQWLTALLEGYPYRAKALITWSSNPVYGVAGLQEAVDEKIRDPKNLPLIVSIDPFINETSTYADYIVPDRVFYEAWGWTKPWGAVPVKDATARWPVVDCRTGTTTDGRHMDMENFFIDVGKRMGLPGFGDEAVPDADGTLHPLNRGEEFWLYAGANVAFDSGAVPESSDGEMALTGTDRFAGLMQEVLKPDEWRRVAYVLNRGGRFEALEDAYSGESLAHKYGATLQIWNDTVGTARNSMTGERFPGCPTWIAPAFADGTPIDAHFPREEWPFRIVSTKSQLFSSLTPALKHLRDLRGVNAIGMNVEDAEGLGLATGDKVRLSSPGGSVEGYVLARRGVARGTVAIEHGFGHRQLGASTFQIGERVFEKSLAHAVGVNSNDLGYQDPSCAVPSVLADPVVGSIARQAIPAKVEAVAT